MKKHSKNDYPIRTLCFLIKQGEIPYIRIMKKFAEEINIKLSHGDKIPPGSIDINKINY